MNKSNNEKQVAYIFLDEGGNFDFSLKGTKFFTLTSVLKFRPFNASKKLLSLKYDLMEYDNLNLEYFHASEDRQMVRNQVFDILNYNLSNDIVDSVIIKKDKVNNDKYKASNFYAEILGYSLRYVINKLNFSKINKVIIITDSLPIKKQRKEFEKSIKKTLKEQLPNNISYKMFHHSSKSSCGLQIVDYFNWAIFRKWERDDNRSFDIIKGSIRSEKLLNIE